MKNLRRFLPILFLLIPFLALAGGQPDWELDQRTDNRWKRVAIETTDEGEFLRGGNVLCTDADGIVNTNTANNRCFEEVGSPDLMGRVEPGHKNLVPYSSDFSNWTTSDVSIAANVTGPDGGANTATTITDGNVGADDYIFIAVNPESDNEKYTYTVHVKEGTSADFTLIVRDTGASATRAEIDFEWTAGVLSVKAEDTGTGAVKQLASSDYWRCSVYVPASVVVEANAHEVRLYPTENGRQAAETLIAWGVDFIEFPQEMSPVVTTGAAASSITEAGNPHYDIPLQGGARVEQYDDAVWVKTDPNGVVFNDGNLISIINGDRNQDYHYTQDQGDGNITDFIHTVDVNVTSITDDTASVMYIHAVAEVSDDLNDIDSANGDAIWVQAGRADPTNYEYKLTNLNGGSITTDTSVSIAVGTKSFPSIERDGTTATVEIYSTSALRSAGGAGDIDTLTLTVVNTPFRYVYAIASRNTGETSKDIFGTIENLSIGTHSEIFETKLGQELASGTLVIGDHYKITADAGNHFYAGSAAGEYFTATATTGLDGTNKVREVLNSGGVPEWTFVVGRWRASYNFDDTPNDNSAYAIIGTQDSIRFLQHRQFAGDGRMLSFDETSFAVKEGVNWAKDTDYKLAVKAFLENNELFFAVGVEEIGSTFDAASWGVSAIFSGSFVVSGNEFQIGSELLGLFGPFHIQWLGLFNRPGVTDGEINAYH